MNIGLLECDHVPEKYRPISGGYREMFARLFAHAAPEARFTFYDACHGELPATTGECDVYLCTGSRHSVYGADAWIVALQVFVRALHDARKRFVGICFGQQLLAQAVGGEVAPAAGGWSIGAHAMRIAMQEPWMRPPLASCRLQYMHADQVQRLPPGAVVLGASEHCAAAMFRVGADMLGIAGHPEFSAAYNEALMRSRVERIGSERVQAALASLAQPTDHAAVAQWIVNFFREGAISR